MTSREDRILAWKVRSFAVGAGLALGGIFLEWRWLIPSAILILLIGLFLRFLQGGKEKAAADDQDRSDDPE